ncbi:MAG: hypothetical protein Q9M94_01695 [Candidatus Gracilibacteria bacterium]|nr:hypothetical protein [Candidatus Gracilibacteria bacterium]MDQ7023460.1 hypothetical protein [Candidatus Gracilibacteria bacterium]
MGVFAKNKNNGLDLEEKNKKRELSSEEVEKGLNDFQKNILESAKLSDKDRKRVLKSR